MRWPRFLSCVLACALPSSCALFVTAPGTLIDSTPPGATVLVDGRDSGYVTPCMIELDKGDDVRVRLTLDGYVPFQFVAKAGRTIYVIPWSDGRPAPFGSRSSPLTLPPEDLLLPVRVDRGHLPGRVHVELQPEAGQ